MQKLWTAVLAAGMLLMMTVGLTVGQTDDGSTQGDAGCTQEPCFPQDPYVGEYAEEDCGNSPQECCNYLGEGTDRYNRCIDSCEHYTPHQWVTQSPVWTCNLEPVETGDECGGIISQNPNDQNPDFDDCGQIQDCGGNPCQTNDTSQNGQPNDQTQEDNQSTGDIEVDTEVDVLIATIVAIILGILAGA